MEELFSKLGVDNIDDAIKVVSDIEPVVVSVKPLSCSICPSNDADVKNIPIVYAELAPVKPRVNKSVRFSDNVKENIFEEDRSEKINVKEVLSSTSNDVCEFECQYGGYIDDTSERMVLVGNNRFNRGPKVNDLDERKSIKIISHRQKKQYFIENYQKLPNPVAHVCESILLDGDEIIKHLSEEFIVDCVIYLMQLYNDLEDDGSMITLSYKQGVTVSNKEGKRQRGILKSNIEKLTNSF